jgi:anaerobic selenocysteine-containing dehydrogenase
VPQLNELVSEAVPFYKGLGLDEIGGQGARWQERDAASALEADELSSEPLADPPAVSEEGLVLAGAPSLWTGTEIEHSPALAFLDRGPVALLSVEDARGLGVRAGDEIELSAGGQDARASVDVRTGVPRGAVLVSGAELPEGPVDVRPASPATAVA